MQYARITRLFRFELTSDQRQAIDEIAADLARDYPMNRLLQGEVGSGKTVVGEYAMLLAVAHGYQAVLMSDPASLAVTFDWTTVPKDQEDKLWTIWYAVDPTLLSTEELIHRYQTSVGRYATVYYKEKCNVYSALHPAECDGRREIR